MKGVWCEGGRQRTMAGLLTLGSHFRTNKQQAACGHLHVTGHYYTKYIRKHLPQLVPTPPPQQLHMGIPLVSPTFLTTSCGRSSSEHHLSSFPSNWLFEVCSKRKNSAHSGYLILYCLYVYHLIHLQNISDIEPLTVSSLLRTFFTAKSLMTESTSPSNTSASILATSFSDDRMVGSRGFSRLRPLTNFCRWPRKEQSVYTTCNTRGHR